MYIGVTQHEDSGRRNMEGQIQQPAYHGKYIYMLTHRDKSLPKLQRSVMDHQ
jgi:hypothetical protein